MTEEEKKKLGSLAEQFSAVGHRSAPAPTQAEPLSEIETKVEATPFSVSQSQTVPPAEADTDAQTYVHTYRKRGHQRFEVTHQRMTVWVQKPLVRELRRVAKRLEMSQTELFEEAIHYVIKKYERE